MSKKTDAEIVDQLISGPGKIRKKIRDVRFVADTQGNPLQAVAVCVGKTWHLLDANKLGQGHSDELVRIATRSRIALDIVAADRRRLCDQILAAQKDALVLLEPSGYQLVHHESDVKEVFVWRGEPHWVGEAPDFEWMVGEAHVANPSEPVGTLEEWKAYAESFSGNHYLVVGLAAALSALIAKPLGVDTLSLLYVGRSSIGKGAIQQAVKSIIGKPVLDSASGTARGMQQSYSELGGQPVFPEDLRQQKDIEALVALLFDIGNRAARNVGHASQSAIKGKPMECLVFGTNERTIEEMLGGVKYDAGLEARVLEIQIHESIGAFHHLPEGFSDGRKFSEYLKAGASKYHGTMWDAWVELAAKHLGRLREAWDEREDALLQSLTDDEAEHDGLTQRVLKGVAFWKYCLVIASKKKLIPLKRDAIDESFRFVVQAHLEQRRSGLPLHSESIVNKVRGLIQANPSKFPVLSKVAMHQDRVWGFRHTVKEKPLFLFYPSQLLELIGQDVGRSTLTYALRAAGFLFANEGRDDRVVKMSDGTSVRMFAVRASILSEK